MRRTDHDDFDGLAVGWALHALEPAEEQAFAEHLATCDRCQQLVRESEEALGDLAYDVPMVDPPAAVLERIRHETGASDAMAGGPRRQESFEASLGKGLEESLEESLEERLAPVLPVAPRAARRRPRWPMLAVAAALVLIALLGWNVVLQNRVDQAQRVAAQRESVIDQLGRSSTRAVLTDDANRTVGYVLQSGSKLDIISGGLAPNDTARTTYVLWAVQGSGEPPQAVGTFDVIRTSMDVRSVSGSPPAADTFTGFAVTKEQGRNVPQQPSQVVASGAVLS